MDGAAVVVVLNAGCCNAEKPNMPLAAGVVVRPPKPKDGVDTGVVNPKEGVVVGAAKPKDWLVEGAVGPNDGKPTTGQTSAQT